MNGPDTANGNRPPAAGPEALPEEAMRTQALVLESMAEGVSVCDEGGIITYTNPAFDRMFGYDRHELRGRHVTCLNRGTGEEENRRIFREIADCLVRERFWSGEFENLRKDGQPLTTRARISTLEAGSRRLWITVQEDVTERREAERKLQRANRELDAFVYTLSHDLRTPLTVILGFAEVLEDHCGAVLDETGRSAVKAIEQQGARMLAMMEDLLALARLGRLPEPEEGTDSGVVAREIVAGLRGRSGETAPEVRLLSLPEARIPPTFLTQLLANLIGNALRHAGPEGGPVEVGGERSGRVVRFFVRDHGPGIPAGERERIFDLFHRGGGARRSSGSGVGLATVRRIAGHYGGRAWVEETPGGGATFRVELVEPTADKEA